ALVVAEVEVGLAAVVGDEHLAVLERVHGSGVDVDVRVELLHRDPETPGLEEAPEGGCGAALAETRGYAAGHEDVLPHDLNTFCTALMSHVNLTGRYRTICPPMARASV